MPKTKNAFALRWLYDEIIRCDEARRDVDPNDDFAELVYENYFDPMEKYLKIHPDAVSCDDDDGEGKLDLRQLLATRERKTIGEFNRRMFIEWSVDSTRRVERMQGASKKIERHIERLRRYSQKIFAEILSAGLTDNLKAKGDRARLLIGNYNRMSEDFSDCAKFLNDNDEVCAVEFNKKRIKIFSARLRKARKKKKLTQAEIAYRLKMSRVGYAHYELEGRDPPLTMLIRLSAILDVPLDWLCGVTKE